MSLNIYTAIEDIPDKMRYIKCNDAFFDEDERREALEDAGLDPDDFGF
jgi:hypothetical protein